MQLKENGKDEVEEIRKQTQTNRYTRELRWSTERCSLSHCPDVPSVLTADGPTCPDSLVFRRSRSFAPDYTRHISSVFTDAELK